MRIRISSYLLMSALLLTTLVGCGGTPKKPAPTIPPPTREMPSQAPENQPEPGMPEAIPTQEPAEVPSDEKMRYGYRVQVAAFTEQSKAEERAGELRDLFAEPIYVVHEGLLYKIQVGDFVSRDKANALRRKAIDLGLAGSFVLDTMIREP